MASQDEDTVQRFEDTGVRVHARLGREHFRTELRAGPHALVADEPEEMGGTDQGPTPYDLLMAALGSCTAMTLRMYADHKRWPLDEVEVHLRHYKIHARDCAECEAAVGKVDHIERTIELRGDLTPEQRARLIEIATRCPVNRTLTHEIRVHTREARPPEAGAPGDAPGELSS